MSRDQRRRSSRKADGIHTPAKAVHPLNCFHQCLSLSLSLSSPCRPNLPLIRPPFYKRRVFDFSYVLLTHTSDSPKMADPFSLLKRVYLSIYNWAVFLGWVQVLFFAVKTLKESGHEHVYDAVEKPLLLAQSAAFLEIVHSLIGLVRSPISATLPQIASRLYLVWGILYSFPEIRTRIPVSSLVISWSITEIIRYSFFGTKEVLGFAPSWLTWLRYSSFLVLYPTGISSEVGLIFLCLPYIKNSEKYCVRMPNKWNFGFDYYYASLIGLATYVPGSPHMYNYMLGQRKKVLSKTKRE